MTGPLDVSSLQVEAQAAPEAWRPVVEPGARVLVVGGELDIVGRVVPVHVRFDSGDLGVRIDGRIYRMATRWAPVGSLEGGKQPAEGDRMKVIRRRASDLEPGHVGIFQGFTLSDGVPAGARVDTDRALELAREWAVLPPAPSDRNRIAEEFERARERHESLPPHSRPVVTAPASRSQTRRLDIMRVAARAGVAEVLGLAPGETVEPMQFPNDPPVPGDEYVMIHRFAHESVDRVDGDGVQYWDDVSRELWPHPRCFRVIPAGGSGDGGDRDG